MLEQTYQRKPSVWRRIFDPDFIEYRKYLGWSDYLPFYRLHCPVHGETETYPMFHSRKLICLQCRKEANQK